MVQHIKNHIDLITERIKENIKIDEVIIFGSYAYGEPNNESDIDLCIIIDDKDIKKRQILRQIRKLISPIMEYPMDILLFNKDEFYDKASFATTLEYKISEEGVRVYGQH